MTFTEMSMNATVKMYDGFLRSTILVLKQFGKRITDNLTKEELEDFNEIIDMMQRNLEQ